MLGIDPGGGGDNRRAFDSPCVHTHSDRAGREAGGLDAQAVKAAPLGSAWFGLRARKVLG